MDGVRRGAHLSYRGYGANHMRRWLGQFFLSGQFLIWLGVIALLLTILLPDNIGDVLFAVILLLGLGTFVGWSIYRFFRYVLVWSLRRALVDFSTLPIIIVVLFLVTWLLSSVVSWVAGDGETIGIATDAFDELVGLTTFVGSNPIFLVGLALGGVLPFFAFYRRKRQERSGEYLSAKQQLRQFLNYYLKAWRLRSAKELPFQHEWSASPQDVGKPREDEVQPYLDLLVYRRKWWRRLQRIFGRKT